MGKRVAVLTSGGDAPGMNAAIRAVVRTGLARDWEMFGVRLGFKGLFTDNIIPLGARDVGGIIQRGGTILGSARCPEFLDEDTQRLAIRNLRMRGIDSLVVIGGNGSQKGTHALHKLGYPVVGVASTIDNDLFGSEITLGVDTALNIAIEAIDRLKITASSHHRAFLVEVMGRDCGYLAIMSAIAGGAESVVIPEVECNPDDVAMSIQRAYESGKAHAIVVVAEGAKYNAMKLDQYFNAHLGRLGFSLRISILGHIQRGGNPGAFDRILASRLGAGATDSIAKSEFGVLKGWIKSEVRSTPLEEVITNHKSLDMALIELARTLD